MVIGTNEAYYSTLGFNGVSYVDIGEDGDAPVVAPDLASLAQYKLVVPRPSSAASYLAVPWSTPMKQWTEDALGGAIQTGVMDIDIPIGTPPAGGWPWIMRLHATGETYPISGGYLNNYVRLPGLARGYAIIPTNFRHPVSNADQGFPHDDVGMAIQYVRAIATALNLNPERGFLVCSSRGNIGILDCLRPNLKNPSANTYEGRMDSDGIVAIWSLSGAATVDPLEWASWYMSTAPGSGPTTGTWAGMTAYDAYLAKTASESPGGELPPNGVMDSCVRRLVTLTGGASPKVPKLVMIHKDLYHNPVASTVAAWPTLLDDKHYSNNGQVLRQAYIANGYESRILTLSGITEDNANGREDQFADCIPVFQLIEQGYSVKEAYAIALTARRAGRMFMDDTILSDDAGIYYLPPTAIGSWPAFSGAAQFADGTVPVTAVASPVGALVDGSYGRANRVLVAPSLRGVGAGQTGGTNKGTIQQFANGARGILFDSTDRLIAAYANGSSTQACYSWCNTAGVAYLATVAANRSATQVFYGQLNSSPGSNGDLTNKVNSLTIIHKNAGGFNAQDLQAYAAFAREIDGVSALLNP